MNWLLQLAFLSVALTPFVGEHVQGETLYCKRTTGAEDRIAVFAAPQLAFDENNDIGGAEAATSILTEDMSGACSAGGFYNASINSIVAAPESQCFNQILLSSAPGSNLTESNSFMTASFEVQPSSVSAATSGQVIGYLSVIGSQALSGNPDPNSTENGFFNAGIGPYGIEGSQANYGNWVINFYDGSTKVASYESSSQGGVIFFEFPVSVNSTIPMNLSQGFLAFASGTYSINISATALLTFSVEAYDPNSENPVSLSKRISLQEGGEEDEVLIYSDEEE